MELCNAQSAGLSLIEQEGGALIFRWRAIAGRFAENLSEQRLETSALAELWLTLMRCSFSTAPEDTIPTWMRRRRESWRRCFNRFQ
jgi:hypothetical protein